MSNHYLVEHNQSIRPFPSSNLEPQSQLFDVDSLIPMTTETPPNSTYKFPAVINLLGVIVRTLNLFAPPIAATLAYRMSFVPGRSKMREGEAEMLSTAELSKVKIGNRSIALYAWGKGPLILMAHGWASRASRLSAIGLALASKGYRVIAFDAPGNGESSGRTTSAVEVASIISVLVEMYGPIAGAVTHSFGGTAMGIAMRDGLILPKYVCIAAPADGRRMIHLYLDALKLSSKLKQRVLDRVTVEFGADIWDRLTLYHNPTEFTVPTLIIHDTTDGVAPYKDAVAVANGWPNAELLTTNGFGHRRMLRDEHTIKRIASFFGEAVNSDLS